MKRAMAILALCATAAICLGQTWSDRMPPQSAILLTSYDRGDASDVSYLRLAPTVGGGPTFTARTMSLDGVDDWISYPDNSLQRSYPLTVACWFNMGGNDQVQYASIIDKYNTGSANGWQIWTDTSEAVHAWYFGGGTANSIYGGGDGLLYTPSGYKSAGWTHLAVVFSSSGGEIYINGASVDTQAWTGTPTASTSAHRLGVGQHNFSGGRYFKGGLDDLRIYNVALTAAQIAAIYAEGYGVTRP